MSLTTTMPHFSGILPPYSAASDHGPPLYCMLIAAA